MIFFEQNTDISFSKKRDVRDVTIPVYRIKVDR